MAKLSDVFVNNYISTNSIPDGPLTVRRVEEEDIGGETKLVMYFAETDKGLPLNRTNAETLAELLNSDDTDDWDGARVTLVRDRTQFRGKRVACVRIASATAAAAAAGGGAKKNRKDADSNIT